MDVAARVTAFTTFEFYAQGDVTFLGLYRIERESGVRVYTTGTADV